MGTDRSRGPLPTSIFIAIAVMLLSLSAWAFLFNDRLVSCTSVLTDPQETNKERFGCVTVYANAYDRQNWIAGILGAVGFASLGVPTFRKMRGKLSADVDEVSRRVETERQLEAEAKAKGT